MKMRPSSVLLVILDGMETDIVKHILTMATTKLYNYDYEHN